VTDGLTEATSAENVVYGNERLDGFVRANRFMSAAELVNSLAEDVSAFSTEAKSKDDRTMLAFQLR
jgi:serine phosphatase RsbU (regulator of sigma subunit)